MHLVESTYDGPFPIRIRAKEKPYTECPFCGSDVKQKGHLWCGLCFMYADSWGLCQRSNTRIRRHTSHFHEDFFIIAAHELLNWVHRYEATDSTLDMHAAFDIEYERDLNVSLDIFPAMSDAEVDRSSIDKPYFWQPPRDSLSTACKQGHLMHGDASVLESMWTPLIHRRCHTWTGHWSNLGSDTYRECRLYSESFDREWNVRRMLKLMEHIQIDNLDTAIDPWVLKAIEDAEPWDLHKLNPHYVAPAVGSGSVASPLDLASDSPLPDDYDDHAAEIANAQRPVVSSADEAEDNDVDGSQLPSHQPVVSASDSEEEEEEEEVDMTEHHHKDEASENDESDDDRSNDMAVDEEDEDEVATDRNPVASALSAVSNQVLGNREQTPFADSSGNEEEDVDSKQEHQPAHEIVGAAPPRKVRKTTGSSVNDQRQQTFTMEQVHALKRVWEEEKREKRRRRKARKKRKKDKDQCREDTLRKDRDDRDPDDRPPRHGRGRGKPGPKAPGFNKAGKGPKSLTGRVPSTTRSRRSGNGSRKKRKQTAMGCPKGFKMVFVPIGTPSPSPPPPVIVSPATTPELGPLSNNNSGAGGNRSPTVEYSSDPQEAGFDCPYVDDVARWTTEDRYDYYWKRAQEVGTEDVPMHSEDDVAPAVDAGDDVAVAVEEDDGGSVDLVSAVTVYSPKRRPLEKPMGHFQLTFKEQTASEIHAKTTPSQSTRKSVRTMSRGLPAATIVSFQDVVTVPIFAKVQSVQMCGRLALNSLVHSDSLIVDEGIELIICSVPATTGTKLCLLDVADIAYRNPMLLSAYNLAVSLCGHNCDRDHSLRARHSFNRLGGFMGLEHAVKIITDAEHELDYERSLIFPSKTVLFHPLDATATIQKMESVVLKGCHFSCSDDSSSGAFAAMNLFVNAEREEMWKWMKCGHDLIRSPWHMFKGWYTAMDNGMRNINPMQSIMKLLKDRAVAINIDDLKRSTVQFAEAGDEQDCQYSVRLSIRNQGKCGVRRRKKAFTKEELLILNARCSFFMHQDMLQYLKVPHDVLLHWITATFAVNWVPMLFALFTVPFALNGNIRNIRTMEEAVWLRPAIVVKLVYEAASVVIDADFLKWTLRRQRRILLEALCIFQQFILRALDVNSGSSCDPTVDGWTRHNFQDFHRGKTYMSMVHIDRMNWRAFGIPPRPSDIIDLCDEPIVLLNAEDSLSAEPGHSRSGRKRQSRGRASRNEFGRHRVDAQRSRRFQKEKDVQYTGSRYTL